MWPHGCGWQHLGGRAGQGNAAAKQRLAGLLVAGARRQLALAMLADVLQAIAGVPELAGIVAVTVDPDAATSLCAPASRHGARRIAMVTPARSWPRTCRSRTAKKFEIDKPGMHTTDTVDYGIVPDARSGWSSTTASKSSSAARRGRPERHSPCVAKQERQARQDGFRADRGAAQCVADWVGLGAWNVGNPWLGRVFARRGERWLTRSFV